MATTLTNTGVTFPDSTTQTTAATGLGTILASGDLNSSTGTVTLTWATTGIKRLSVNAMGLYASGGLGQVYIQVGHTTTPVSTSSYNSSSQRTEYSTNAYGSYNSQSQWSVTSAATAQWYQNAHFDIGLLNGPYPCMVGSMQCPSAAISFRTSGMYVGSWATAQFQSITLWISGGATYAGTVTVVGYT